MTIAPGTRLGPYEIVGPIGSGGMGEVYRAHDARLGRDVAIKVLPSTVGTDPERLARFEQEARAASLLNHPNILAVYDVDIAGPSPYVVMELLEGETLRSRLAGGALGPRRAVEYASQIAAGLAAAHERGVVHRDLKPENLFVTRDHRVKILDFGLAKLVGLERFGAGEATVTVAVDTQPGAVLGTAGYMSPEQVRGEPADQRSDIFSFGAILYEMLAGRRAFKGDSAVETMGAILKEDPPELTQTNHQIAPALERIVLHCLEKDPGQRFQSARDLAFNLEALSTLSSGSQIGAVEAAPARRLTRALPVLAVLAALAGGLLLGGLLIREGRAEPPTFRQLTFRRGVVPAAFFGPDGQSVIYSAAWSDQPVELYVTRPGSPESRPLGYGPVDLFSVSSAGELAVARQPTGRRAFGREGTLARVPMAGGAPRDLLEDIEEAVWAPDGERLAIVRTREARTTLEFPAGTVLFETLGYIGYPRFSPDGQRLAFIHHPAKGDDGGGVAVVSLEGELQELSVGWSSIQGLAWSPEGQELWFAAAEHGANRDLHAIDLDGSARRLTATAGALVLHDVAADGRVLVSREVQRTEIVAKPPGQETERELTWLDWSIAGEISDDGRTILFTEAGEGGGTQYSAYLRPTDGGPAVKLADGLGTGLSADASLALIVPRDARGTIRIVPTGAGEARSIETPLARVFAALFGGRTDEVIAVGLHPEMGLRIFRIEAATGELEPLTPTLPPSGPNGGAAKPDGTAFVASNPEGTGFAIYRAGQAPEPVPALTPRDRPIEWSGEGNAIYVATTLEPPVVIERVDLDSGQREPVATLSPPDPAGVTGIGGISMTPTAHAYLYGYSRTLSELYLIEGLR